MRKIIAVLVVAGVLVLTPGLSEAGAVLGPINKFDSVRAFETDVYRIAFFGGERAVIQVNGDGDTDLDLFVYDAFGNLIDLDVGPTDNCLATFVPARTGTFTIRIVNRGRVFNRYRLRTN